MKSNLDEVHDLLVQIASHSKGKAIKLSLKEIPEISEKNWSSFKSQLLRGQPQVSEMAISSASFDLFAAPSDKAGWLFFNTLAWTLVPVAIVLSFLYSWWFLLLIFGSFFLIRTAKSFYRTVVFQAVTASEQCFCFLFSTNAICLNVDGNLVFRKNEL